MTEHIIPLEDLTELEIASTGGSLYLAGWNKDQIRIRDFSDQDQVKKKKTKLSLTFSGDAFLHIPHSLDIVVDTIGGDGSIKGIRGGLQISSVGGDLSLVDTNAAKVKSIGGNLIANRVQGDILIDNIGGDGLIDNIKGQLSLQQVGGDVDLEKVDGGINLTVGGGARLSFNPVSWQAYEIKTGGDISTSIPDDSSVSLSIHSDQEDITVIIGDQDQKLKEKDFSLQLGEGGAPLMLSAGGKVFLTGDDFTWLTNIKINAEEFENLAVDFSNQTAEQIRNQLGNLEEDIRSSFSGISETFDSMGISEENLQNIARRIEDSSRVAAQKAEIAAIKAQAKAEKRIALARKKALKFKAKSKEFDVNKFLTMREQRKAVSADERMLILKMLQEKKISPDEADVLLQALEGKKIR